MNRLSSEEVKSYLLKHPLVCLFRQLQHHVGVMLASDWLLDSDLTLEPSNAVGTLF